MAKSKKSYVPKYLGEYKKQVTRIKRAISKMEKEGYSFAYELPKQPKRITKKSVEALKRVTPAYLRTTGYNADPSTGEAIPAAQYFAQERKRKREERKAVPAAQFNEPSYSEPYTEEPLNGEAYVIDRVRELLTKPNREEKQYYQRKRSTIALSETTAKQLLSYLDGAIANFGEKQIAHNLAKNYDSIEQAVSLALYAYDEATVSSSIFIFAEAISGRALDMGEAQAFSEAYDAEDTGDYYI